MVAGVVIVADGVAILGKAAHCLEYLRHPSYGRTVVSEGLDVVLEKKRG